MIGLEGGSYVPVADFQYPDDGETETPVVRDAWVNAPLLTKCQQRFAPVRSGDVLTRPLLDKRLDVLQYALREAVESMDVRAICRLADKARATVARITAEELADSTPASREIHGGDVVIHDDAERGKVVIHFPDRLDAGARRWLKMCGFAGSGDACTYWRRRTFRRGENIALDSARRCVEHLLEVREKVRAGQQAELDRQLSNPLCK